jgi:hypothetical protein
MQLPNANKARIEARKITGYLLCHEHDEGGDKAAFFTRFGFTVAHWQEFAAALRRHGQQHPVATRSVTRFGACYTVEGWLETPDGRNPSVRTVWTIDTGRQTPRLITAYPL